MKFHNRFDENSVSTLEDSSAFLVYQESIPGYTYITHLLWIQFVDSHVVVVVDIENEDLEDGTLLSILLLCMAVFFRQEGNDKR